MRRLLALAALLAALLTPALAQAQQCGNSCLFQPLVLSPPPGVDQSPQQACRACGWSMVVLDAFLPLTAAVIGHLQDETRTGTMPVMIGAFTLSSVFYTGAEMSFFWMGGRTRPAEHWLALFAVRGAATALAYVAGRQLNTAGTVLATGLLVAGSVVPVLVFDFEENGL